MKLSVLSILVVMTSVLTAAPAFAKTTMNAICYMENAKGSPIQGEHTQELFEIASVSKMFVSFWALHELGAQFRFATGVHITPVNAQQVDVHLEGSLDPFFGRQLTHFLVSELYRLGVRQIRNLTFDEGFKLRWGVLISSEQPLDPPVTEIAEALASHLKFLAKEYPQTVQEAAKGGLRLSPATGFKVLQVSFLPKASFQKLSTTSSFSLKSAPLFLYLKEMNVVSNNHLADKFFDYLGGAEKFQAFFRKELSLEDRNLQFINGSGNSVVVGQDTGGKPIKQYNRATCETMIKVLVALQNELKYRQSLDLTDVLSVSQSDGGTMSPRYDGIPNTLVAKTGTVDPAVTMTGVISSAQGNVYFGVLLKTDGVSDWEQARDQVRTHVFDLMKRYGGARAFPYQARYFLPFDGLSALQISSPVLAKP